MWEVQYVMRCYHAGGYQRFGGKNRVFSGWSADDGGEMEVKRSSETLVNAYKITHIQIINQKTIIHKHTGTFNFVYPALNWTGS
jgi:hypothetical protein